MTLEYPLVASFALVAGPWLFWRGFRTMRTRRLIADTPTARIRSMAMGLVEIDGLVEPRSTLGAPFSGAPCAYWEIDIAARSRRGWTIVHRNRSGNPFFLRDETGLALVYPQGAEFKIRFGKEEECAGLTLPPCYSEYMNTHASPVGQMARMGRLRFRERMLEAGDHVYVLGTAVPRAQEVVVSEGDLLRATGTDDASATRVQTLDHAVTAVIRCGEVESTFLVSQESERSLMFALGGRALMQLAGGPALTLLGLGYWLVAISSGQRPW